MLPERTLPTKNDAAPIVRTGVLSRNVARATDALLLLSSLIVPVLGEVVVEVEVVVVVVVRSRGSKGAATA